MTRTMHLALAVAGGVALAAPAGAAAITGQMNMVGNLVLAFAFGPPPSGAPVGLDGARFLDFQTCTTVFGPCSPGGTSGTAFATTVRPAGNTLGTPVGSAVQVADFSIVAAGPISNFLSPGPGNPSGLFFDLGSFSVTTQSASNLNIVGLGTLRRAGFDDSPADISISVTATALSQPGIGFPFTIVLTAPPGNGGGGGEVPTPAAFALFGAGLLGLALVRRRAGAAA